MEDGQTYLGKYRIEGILGRGGMGVVYKGFDPNIERVVAVKTVRMGALEGEEADEVLQRFKREAQAVGRLAHPNIVSVYEYGEHGGKPYIAMEFVEGRELAELLESGKRFDLPEAVVLMEQVFSALAYCHAHGVVHRDLKPANILMLDDGKPKLTDFGIARIESSTLTRTGAVMGTPDYMSPEQLTGQGTDARSDLFSAAVILYELITGERPFPGKTFAGIMNRVMRGEFDRPSEVNVHVCASWDRLLARGLATRPDDRFQTAENFLEGLRLAVEDRYEDEVGDRSEAETMIAPARPRTTMGVARGPAPSQVGLQTSRAAGQSVAGVSASAPRPRWWPALAALAILAAAGGAGGWWAMQRMRAPAPALATAPPEASPVAVASPAPAAPAPAGAEERGAPSGAPAAASPVPVGIGQGALEMRTSARDGIYYGLVAAQSSPPGATLFIDNVSFGVTPLELEVPPGTYSVSLQKQGFRDLRTQLSIEPGTRIDLEASLSAR
jgi:serine/threonine-protein kinase